MFEVLSVREIFFCFFLIFKNHKWNLQVSVAGGYGQGCKINFQIGELDSSPGWKIQKMVKKSWLSVKKM